MEPVCVRRFFSGRRYREKKGRERDEEHRKFLEDLRRQKREADKKAREEAGTDKNL